jgi:hypothetical protein
MSDPISRREALRNLALLAGVVIAGSAVHQAEGADALPHVTANDPLAVSFNYVEDSSKVDVKKNPTYTPTQRCSTCVQFKGQATDAFGPCAIFAGKSVSSKGWCKVYVKKT